MATNLDSVRRLLLCLLLFGTGHSAVPQEQPAALANVHVRVQPPKMRPQEHAPPIVIWLNPIEGTRTLPFVSNSRYTLMQKNRMFTPHLIVVPVGSDVFFPNADPFFHNVFSLFNGKRFDLGLYEAGTTKRVTFTHEGVSYIFCNIHPEMSAVVLVLSTPLYTTLEQGGTFSIRNVPAGTYEMHVWIEGLTQPALDRLTRRVEVSSETTDLGVIDATGSALETAKHLNKFGRAYDRDSKPAY